MMKKEKIRVLQAVYCLERGGAERLTLDIARELTKREDIEVMLVSFDKRVEIEYNPIGIPYQHCPSSVSLSPFGKSMLHAEKFQKVVDDFKPNIIHSHKYLSELITRFNISKKIKYITHCHDNIIQFEKPRLITFFNKEKITNLYERNFLFKKYVACNNNFIAVSEDTLNYIKHNLPSRLKENICLMHNAIDFNKFYNKKKQFENNVIKKRSIKLINIGSLIDKKNQCFLIDVMAYLKDLGYDATLDLLGDGPDQKIVEEKINKMNLADRIFCRGNISNVEDFLHGSDIYVHSATYEPFGLVLLEAMAAGLPVVCLDGKGNRDIILDGYNGYMMNSQNAESFAAKYDIVNYTDNLINLYNKILSDQNI